MLWLIDSCQNKVSSDQFHITISQTQFKAFHRGHMFFWSWLLTRCWFWLDHRLRSGHCSGWEGESMFKSKILHTLTLGTLLTPLPTYSSHNHLLESPEYVVYIISTTLGMFIAYSLLKFNWKKIPKPHAEQIHVHSLNWSFFKFLFQEKSIFMVNYCYKMGILHLLSVLTFSFSHLVQVLTLQIKPKKLKGWNSSTTDLKQNMIRYCYIH